MRGMLYGLINHLVAPCRELTGALTFLPIYSLLLGRIERFRGQTESGSIHMNLHRPSPRGTYQRLLFVSVDCERSLRFDLSTKMA